MRKLLLIIVLCSAVFSSLAQNIPARPNPPRLVNDFANVLSPEQEASLEHELVALDDSTSNQVAIVLVKTLDGYPIEEYSLKILREWGIGSKATNNGVLILAAIDDRDVRIEVGYGLEGAIPDVTAKSIISNEIAPEFREGDYFRGLHNAAVALSKAAAGEYHVKRERKPSGRGSSRGGFLIAIIVIAVILMGIGRGGGGRGGGMISRRGYGGIFPPIFIGGSGFGGGGGGFGGGGFGGGGFGGFGGGGGGGGGASGSW